MNKKVLIPIVILAVLVIVLFGVLLLKNYMDNISQNAFGFNMTETDPAVCDKLTETAAKDTCYNVVAANTKDISICEEISRSDQKDICLSGVAKKLE